MHRNLCGGPANRHNVGASGSSGGVGLCSVVLSVSACVVARGVWCPQAKDGMHASGYVWCAAAACMCKLIVCV
jgi:hypothetical protein